MKKLAVLYLVLIFFVIGCAEGPLWQTGSYLPWVRKKWLAEEQLAETYFQKKRSLDQLVDNSGDSLELQNKAAKQLADIVYREPILLLRLHAVELLGKIPTSEAARSLQIASKDPESQIRTAAAKSLGLLPAEYAIPALQEIIGSDTNVDVRLAATKALGRFSDSAAFTGLSIALTDTNPAIQYAATESLNEITGEKIGADVAAWQSYLSAKTKSRTANSETTGQFR